MVVLKGTSPSAAADDKALVVIVPRVTRADFATKNSRRFGWSLLASMVVFSATAVQAQSEPEPTETPTSTTPTSMAHETYYNCIQN